MSKIKPENAFAKQSITAFGGIHASADLKAGAASDMRNFRLLPDGRLEKRFGWYSLRTLSQTVRGVWKGELDGVYCTFLVQGNEISLWRTGLGVSKVGELSTDTGDVCFARYGERLYLFDGDETRIFDATSATFSVAACYAPLYGHNWHPTALGEVEEPLNLLTGRLRVHYLNTPGSKTVYLPFFAKSVDSVRVNNQVCSDYTFLAGSDHFTLSDAYTGDVVEVAFTVYGESSEQKNLRAAKSAKAFQGTLYNELLLFGAPKGHCLYRARPVSDLKLNECRVAYGDADKLYVTNDGCFLAGDAEHPVSALVGHLDRILVFSTNATFSMVIDQKTDEAYLYPVVQGIGCASQNAALAFENDVITVAENGVFRLSATAGDPDKIKSEPISESVSSLMGGRLFKNAILFWSRSTSELWLRDKTEAEEGLVWVWSSVCGEWYCFDGIPAAFFFENEGEAAFASQNELLQFDRDYFIDGGKSYVAYYQSGFSELCRADALKRSASLGTCISTGKATLEATLESESGSRSFSMECPGSTTPIRFSCRFGLGRFRFLRYRISCTGTRPCLIHQAELLSTL